MVVAGPPVAEAVALSVIHHSHQIHVPDLDLPSPEVAGHSVDRQLVPDPGLQSQHPLVWTEGRKHMDRHRDVTWTSLVVQCQ